MNPNIGHFACPQSFFDILCYLESFFHVEEDESAHVDPRAAGYCLERVLDETSVVVPQKEVLRGYMQAQGAKAGSKMRSEA